jgi:putative two-component system response regulator
VVLAELKDNHLEQYNDQLKSDVERKTEELKRSYIDTIFALSKAAEFRDEDTGII